MRIIAWSLISAIFFIIAIIAYRSDKPAGFFANESKKPEVKDVKAYNHAVAKMWFVYGILLWICGIPFFTMKQNSALVIIPVLGTVFISLGLVVAYTVFIEPKYRK